jgi:transposase InsO family protein
LNSFLLKNKTMTLIISKITLFINNNEPCNIIQTDHGTEFDNTEMRLFCENNHIQFITSSVKHPQSNEL